MRTRELSQFCEAAKDSRAESNRLDSWRTPIPAYPGSRVLDALYPNLDLARDKSPLAASSGLPGSY